jgi:cytochrome c oxidase subunit 2
MVIKILPDKISTYSHEIDNLFYLILVLVSIAFVISLVALLVPLFRRREKAEYFTGEKWNHLKWVVIAVVLLALSDFTILYVEHGTWTRTQQRKPEGDIHMGIIGRQWNWIFVYPGPDNKLWTSDDVIVDKQDSELHVPVNRKIVFDLRAKDVLHNFSVPVLRFKQDAIPGRTITRWFDATQTGRYEIQCAEICGVLHYRMRNFLVVQSEEEYKNFISELYHLAKTDLIGLAQK